MLYLKQPGDEAAGKAPRRLLLPCDTAAALERALLSSERPRRLHELRRALANDPNFAGWTLRLAENRTQRTINRVDEALEWLSDRLEIELAAAVERDDSSTSSSELEIRLLALIAKLGEYARKLNEFDRRLEHVKLESLKELAYGASHEINNPLANIAARAQTLLVDEVDPERSRKLLAIHRQAMRAHEMISDLMLFARPPKLVPRPLDLRALVNRVVDEQREFARERDVRIECEVGDAPINLLADETQLGVAVQALVKNSLEASLAGGHVWVATRGIDSEPQNLAEICVRDDGSGISDVVRHYLFDPFFCGREAGRGLGFGLSKCWRIVTDHGGQVFVNRATIGGAEFSIQLPAVAHGPTP